VIVIFTDDAEDDLEAIGDYIARDDPSRAESFISGLRERCLSLDEFPERFPLLAGRETSGVRRFSHGKYLVFFRVAAESVEVLHVLHGAQDYMAALFPNPS
jgi:toxin ParE1/3/4